MSQSLISNVKKKFNFNAMCLADYLCQAVTPIPMIPSLLSSAGLVSTKYENEICRTTPKVRKL